MLSQSPKDGEVRQAVSGGAGHSLHLSKRGNRARHFTPAPGEGAGPPPSTPVSSSAELVACLDPASLAPGVTQGRTLGNAEMLSSFFDCPQLSDRSVRSPAVVWTLHDNGELPVTMASPPDCCRVQSEYLSVTWDPLAPTPTVPHTPVLALFSSGRMCFRCPAKPIVLQGPGLDVTFACVFTCSGRIRCFLFRSP